MSEQEILDSVGQARERLDALRDRLELETKGGGSHELVNELHGLQALLDTLRTRYGLLRDILDRTSDIVFAKDEQGRYSMINPQGARLFGKMVVDVVGQDDRALFSAMDAQRIMELDREVKSSGVARTTEVTYDLLGAPTTLHTTTTVWRDPNQRVRGVIGISQDVTERRRHERETEPRIARTRTMAAELVIDEALLRRSLAAELHNGLGQDLALVKMKLSMLRGSAQAELHAPLRGIEELVERADRSLRSITFQISPPSLHDLGLAAALQWLAGDVQQQHGLEVQVIDDGSPSVVDEGTRAILYRAVRELLTNVVLHSHSTTAVVRLARHGAALRVTVQDFGDGFDTADLERRGLSLFGIKEQLDYVGGDMQVESSRGLGTTVTLTAPVALRAVGMAP
jgi:PAS domain S-box-containing protein